MRFLQKTALLLSLFILSQTAYGQKQRITEKIAALELRRTTALIQKDLVTLEACLAKDLIFTHSHGVPESKAEFMEAMRIEKYQFSKFDIQPEYYRHFRKGCVVHGTAHIIVFAYGKTYDFKSRYTAVYQKKRGKWRLGGWQNTKIK